MENLGKISVNLESGNSIGRRGGYRRFLSNFFLSISFAVHFLLLRVFVVASELELFFFERCTETKKHHRWREIKKKRRGEGRNAGGQWRPISWSTNGRALLLLPRFGHPNDTERRPTAADSPSSRQQLAEKNPLQPGKIPFPRRKNPVRPTKTQ